MIRRLFLFRLGRQREHHSDDTIENDITESSSSDSETDNIQATDTEPEWSVRTGWDRSTVWWTQRVWFECIRWIHGDDNRELARSESNSENDNTELSFRDFERADENNEATATAAPDDSKCELDGNSSLFDERIGSDLSANDESDGDDDRESTRSEFNSELCSSDSESTDDNTEATATEPELPDDSLCELDGSLSLFDEHGGSELGEDGMCCHQHARDKGKSVGTRFVY